MDSSPQLSRKFGALTAAQLQAVGHVEGPLQVLAGPGSGKTRVITYRIAHLIESGVRPHEILAITFTNKAAREMQARVERLLPDSRVWVSTFHRFCAFMLRRYGQAVGLQPNFSILDTGDQQRLLRQTLHEMDIDPVHFTPAKVLNRISRAKNAMVTADVFAEQYGNGIGNHFDAVVARAYPEYQQRLLATNSVDFDDLLLHVVRVLAESEEVRAELDDRFRFVLVDEYQDTNLAQYQIVRGLSVDHRNLCVTGDPDQSIYGWRGAQIQNILRFDEDFPDARIVRLEENFRSTASILRVADQLIAHNVKRKAKSLITTLHEGAPVQLLSFESGRSEADVLARDIADRVGRGERDWNDFAVFYRVNALSRELELAFSRHRVPFQLAVGLAFYERMEIKDLVSYLRVINNPADEVALLRIINTPTRGIGKTTVNRLIAWARRHGQSVLSAAAQAAQIPQLTTRAVKALQAFVALLDELAAGAQGRVEPLLARVIDRTRYSLGLADSQDEQDLQRLANINELLASARQYDQSVAEPSLEDYLETCSLASDVDALDEHASRVTLMTLHAAKGLEYPVVYIVGVEQNLIPHERALRDGTLDELEEERRLLFVGITRAQQELFLTQVLRRESRGRAIHTIPSEFLSEMQLEFIDRGIGLHQYDGHDDYGDEAALNGLDDEFLDDSFDPSQFADDDVDAPPSADKAGQHSEYSPDAQTEAGAMSAEMDTPPARGVPKLKLVRAADLLEPSGGGASRAMLPPDLPQGFAMGMQVRHPRYGRGTVIGIGGMSRHRTVTVEFDQDGRQETFVAAKSPLQPIANR